MMKLTNLNQLKVGIILNYSTIILTAVVGILLTPFMINKLGDADYGLYALIGAFVGYLTVLDFGLNNSVIRYISKYRSQKDKKAEEEFLGTIFIIYFFISLAIAMVGAILYLNIEQIFGKSLTIQELEKAKIMFIILIFNIAITLPGGAFSAISIGYEKFIFPKLANIIKYLLRAFTLVCILFLGADSLGIVILDTIMNISLIIANIYYVMKVLKVRIKLNSINKKLLKEIFSYSIWIFIIAIAQQFQWNVGQLFLGILTNTKIVAIYAVSIMLGGFYGAFGASISSMLLPKATQLVYKENNSTELTNMMIRVGRISLIILLYIFGAFLLFGNDFINLWIGENYKEAWFATSLIMFVLTYSFMHSFGNSILEAKKMVKFRGILNLTLLIVGTFIGSILVEKYSIIGMIIGITSSMFVYQIIMSIYYNKKVNIDILRFYSELFKGIFLSFFIVLFLGYSINYIGNNSWILFLVKAILFSVIYLFFMYFFAFNSYEKNLIQNFIKKGKS